jgi:hypothetical protein
MNLIGNIIVKLLMRQKVKAEPDVLSKTQTNQTWPLS